MSQSAAPNKSRHLTLVAAFLGWMFDGVEMGIFPLVARPALQSMLGGADDQRIGFWMGWVTALFLFGAALGGLVFGWLGDRIGRVRALSISVLLYSTLTGLCYFATQPWHFAALRFAAALGMGGEWSVGVALVMETWPERHRPWLAGVIGAAANCGFVLIALVAWVFPVTAASWRWFMLVGAVPALLTLFIRLFVPESERWQQATRTRAARPLTEIFGSSLRWPTLVAIVVSSVALIGTWGSVQWIPLWADQITHGQMPTAKATTAMLVAIGAIAGGFLGAMFGLPGRRLGFCVLSLASFGCCALLFRGVAHYDATFLIGCTLVGAAATSFYGWLPLYLPELFPTRVRATAQGISFNFGRILAGFAALASGQLVGYFRGDYARMGATITSVYLFGALIIWLAPETKGRPLPD